MSVQTMLVLHTDTDAGIAQWLCKKLLLNNMPVEYKFVPSGQRIENSDPGVKVFHIDTGGIYDPSRGYFDHHGLTKGHPKYGKCSAVLMMEYIEEQLNISSAEFWTLAQFAQMIDKEKDKSRAEEYNPYNQDPISAGILYKMPEIVNLSKRAGQSSEHVIHTIDTIIAAYLAKRKESKDFKKWYYTNLFAKKIRIRETHFGVPALIVTECPYESGDFRGLVNYYLKAHSFIIAHYLPVAERPFHRYGVNKPDDVPMDLRKVYKIMCEKYPHLANDNNKLFLHNNGVFLYLNEVPEGLTLDEFIKIVLSA